MAIPFLEAILKDDPDRLYLLLREGVNETDKNGFTPLILAAFAGNEKLVKFLLEQEGIQVNKAANRNRGLTPLFLAAHKGHANVVELLLGNKETDVNHGWEGGITPLLSAADSGHDEVVKMVLKRKTFMLM